MPAYSAVVGAGIVGLATAYHLARQGRKVVVFERNTRAVGASVRNFGLLWPIGQAPGHAYTRALRSREIWMQLAREAGFWQAANGSLHLAYHPDERAVLEEFAAGAAERGFAGCALLTPEAVRRKSPGVKADGLLGGLWSSTELTVDPREVVATLPGYLESKWGVTFRFGTAVNGISLPVLETAGETWRVKEVYVCGGLTLRHYAAFKHCASLPALHARVQREMPWSDQWGIHVMVSQNGLGELIIGDSHEYGRTPDPFDKEEIDRLILEYLRTFAQAPDLRIAGRWHGVYPKLTNGGTELVLQPERNVTIINGLGGAGMTLSFGLAEEVVTGTYL